MGADPFVGLAPQRDRYRDELRYSDRSRPGQGPGSGNVDRNAPSRTRDRKEIADRDGAEAKDRAFSDCLAQASSQAASPQTQAAANASAQNPAEAASKAKPEPPEAGGADGAEGGLSRADAAARSKLGLGGARAGSLRKGELANDALVSSPDGAPAGEAALARGPAEGAGGAADASSSSDASGGKGQAGRNGKLRGKLAELGAAARLAAGKADGGAEASGAGFSGAPGFFEEAAVKAGEEAAAKAAKTGGKGKSHPSEGGEGRESAQAGERTGSQVLSAQAPAGAASGNSEAALLKGKGAAEKEGELRVSVTDLRKASSKKEAARSARGDEAAGAGAPAAQAASAKEKVAELDLRLDSGAVSGQGGKGEGLAAEGAKPESLSPARDFASILGEQLKAGWNQDIASSAHIVLKDGDAGTIKLRLHPESLGGVKIELNLADNSISGKIIVESDEARTAFEKNMAQLQDAFTQSGFDSAKLEVQVGSGNANEAGAGGERAKEPFWSERRGLGSLAAAVPEATAPAWASGGRSAVNILA